VSKYRGKHGTALQGFFQGGFEFFAGLVLPGVYEYGAGDFPPQYGLALLHSGQGFGIGGMLCFPAMGANVLGIDTSSGFFGLFYSVHQRLLCLEYTAFWAFMQLFPAALWGLPGTPPLGYFPNTVNHGFIIDIGLPGVGFGLNSGSSKPHFGRPGVNSENFGDFSNGQPIHISIINRKKSLSISLKVIDKHLTIWLNVY
jgi:hypothetical protein